MNNWQNKSDFEINKAVHIVEGMYSEDINGTYMPSFDYCNNPSDSWPIIQRNNIATQPRPSSEEWFAFSICENEFEVIDKNPLRAAMIVYLDIKGVKP